MPVAQELQAHRFLELDSLRGLAAAAVVLSHFAMFYEDKPITAMLLHSPLNITFDGGLAVILFFVLSGFVLTMPFLRRPQPYIPYVVKRACRIYLPYVAGLGLAVAACAYCPPLHTGNYWFDKTWNVAPTLGNVLPQLSGIGNFPAERFNTAFWTLVIEMRVSLLFPLIVFASTRLRTAAGIGISVALAVAAAVTHRKYNLIMFSYFLNGSLLAAHYHTVVRAWQRTSRPLRWAGTVVLLLFAGYATTLQQHFVRDPYLGICLWISSLACIAAMLTATQSRRVRHLLHRPLILHLGTVSYSLYLVHGTVLFGLIHLFWHRISAATLFCAYIALTLLLTEVLHYAVEKPSIVMGRHLDAVLRRRPILNAAWPKAAVMQESRTITDPGQLESGLSLQSEP